MAAAPTTDVGRIARTAARAVAAGDFAAARRLYTDCLGDERAAALVRAELAAVCLALGDHPAALRHASGRVVADKRGRAQIIRAKALRALKRMDASAAAFEQAIATPQTSADLRHAAALELADLHLNTFGDPAGAAQRLAGVKGAASAARASEARLLADLYLGARPPAELAAAFTRHARRYLRPPGAPRRRRAAGGARKRQPPRPQIPRIGIISPSLGASPVGFLTLGAFRELARESRLVYFDRGARKRDWLAEALRATATEWIDVAGKTSAALLEVLRDAGLDALIDCGGWTDMDALAALAARPVRRQFKWVGGQALTTGLDCFDGFLTDRWQVPPRCAELYTEPVLRFAGPYATYTPPPYFDLRAAAAAGDRAPAPGVLALVSNPAKISARTLAFVRRQKPKRLLLIDQRWRYQRTRQTFMPKLRNLCEHVEFVVPADHREYLAVLRDTPATFVDTRPYSMGLTAIELLLLGKTIIGPTHRAVELMSERHCLAHLHTARFDDHAALAAQLLAWVRG